MLDWLASNLMLLVSILGACGLLLWAWCMCQVAAQADCVIRDAVDEYRAEWGTPPGMSLRGNGKIVTGRLK